MDNHHLRSILLKLQDRLSDNDRQRLHFFLGDDVPRRIRDNPTLSGTLNLMESLFDQDKINERDFTFLINAFKEIQCIDAVKLLKEHKKRMQSIWLNQPSVTSMIPSLNDQLVQDQEEDKSAPQSCLYQINNYDDTTKTNNNKNTNINPVSITINNEKSLSSSSEQNQSFYISFRINKYLLFIILLLVIALGTLMIIFIIKISKTNRPDVTKENGISTEEEDKRRKIEELNNLMKILDETNRPLIKAGQIFGNGINGYFDDSQLPDFRCSHYLYGITARGGKDGLESYEFFYISSDTNQPEIQSPIHGNQNLSIKKKFKFDKDEKIEEVNGLFVNHTIMSLNGTNITKTFITGIQFITRETRTPSYNDQTGKAFSEKMPGYTLGYITGKSSQYIEQLQFFWYRILDSDDSD